MAKQAVHDTGSPPPPAPKTPLLTILGFSFAAGAFLFPFLGLLCVASGIAGLALSIKGKVQGDRGKGGRTLAMWGIICALVAIPGYLVLGLLTGGVTLIF